MPRRPILAWMTAALVAALASPAAPAGASNLSHRRESTHRRHSEVVHELNLARASDTQMAARLNALEGALRVERAGADLAVRQAAAATASVQRIRSDIGQLEAIVAEKRALVTRRAVAAYMTAQARPVVVLADAFNLADVARRTELLARLAAADGAAIEELTSARATLSDRQQALSDAQARAAGRARDADAALRSVMGLVHQQQLTRAALDARIAELQAEATALAAEESQVEALIRQHQSSGLRASRDGRVSGLGFAWPLHGEITSPFGPRWGGFHPGIDIADPRGTPIHASKAGSVIFAGWWNGYGNFVIIDHGGGLATAYGHQSSLATSQGDEVRQGQVIGFVGSTGHSTGNHLHFEVRVDGSPEDPMRFLP